MNRSVTPAADPVPDDIALLRAALVAEQLARREAEARASGAEAMVAYLKLLIAKLKHEQDPDQAGQPAARGAVRRKPVRGPLPAHLPRERVVIPGPTACPCCNGKLAKLGEDCPLSTRNRLFS